MTDANSLPEVAALPPPPPAAEAGESGGVSEVESAVIAFFVRQAQSLGQPRSLGEIYGLLFASPEALPFEEIGPRLGLSRGSVSAGLRALQRLGAVRTAYRPGDRRTFFEAEISLKRLVAHFVETTIRPGLEESREAVRELQQQLASTGTSAQQAFLGKRLESVAHWGDVSLQLLPLLALAASAPTVPPPWTAALRPRPDQAQ